MQKDIMEPLPAGALEYVLLVDDNPVNLKILYKTLKRSEYRLLAANSGESALAIAREKLPSLILLDIMMPGMDGYQVCEALKSDPVTESIAIIFLSALEDSSAKVKGFAVGGVDYISKPFQADEIAARVRNHIKIHRLERQLALKNVELVSENQQILNSVGEGIIGLDDQGRVTLLNPAAEKIIGWASADALGEQLFTMNLFDNGKGASMTEEQSLPYRSYRLGVACHSDMEVIRRRDAEVSLVSISCTPKAEGGAVIVFRDISTWLASEENLRLAREEVDAQRQNMAHMERLSTSGEMAAGIAHEVNQPLTAVANYARVAKRLLAHDQIDREKLSDLMDKLDVQSVRASEVIQRLRGYMQKPNAGFESVNPNAIMKDVIALADVDSRINDVAVHFEPQRELPNISVDVVQIQQVALNLIRNAMESMSGTGNEHDGVLVTSSLDGHCVCIQVIDSGVGVSSEVEGELFHPFFSTKTKGMGVGLSICQSIIQAHGGQIGYLKNKGEGSTFFFKLPAE